MRDLLPEASEQRRVLSGRLMRQYALSGYQPVTPPAFELSRVLDRGMGTRDVDDVLRFVEPESGEVAALRPDMTPQIARIVATRLSGSPPPIRLSYDGTVVRRRQGRARPHRQIPQTGVELMGIGSLDGDVEILELLASSLRVAGLDQFLIDVGHAGVVRALVEGLPAELSSAIVEALTEKNEDRVSALVAQAPAGSDPKVLDALRVLPELSGSARDEALTRGLFGRAHALLDGTPARPALDELEELWGRVAPALGAALCLDLGEPRGLAYYTGAIFHALAEGPGEPVAAGGRYDELLARFEVAMPAVGFAIDLDALAWALDAAGAAHEAEVRVLVAADPRASGLVAALRGVGIASVVYDGPALDAYALAWRFTHVVVPKGDVLTVRDTRGAAVVELDGALPAPALGAALAHAITHEQGRHRSQSEG
jgi:ATP phosphoribosyltransferase regulatory subunit